MAALMEEIRQLGPEHAAELGALNRHLIEDEGHANSMSVQELELRMAGWLESGYSCYGIVRSGEIVSYSLHRDDGGHFYLRQLFTARNCRNQGLATKLLGFLQNTVLAGKPLRLDVLAGNSLAAAFYRKRGFNVYCHTLVSDV